MITEGGVKVAGKEEGKKEKRRRRRLMRKRRQVTNNHRPLTWSKDKWRKRQEEEEIKKLQREMRPEPSTNT